MHVCMYVCWLCPRGRVVGLATNQGSDPGSIPPAARTVPPPFVTPPPTRCTVQPLWLVRRDDFRAGRGRLPSTHSSRQPLRCAARVFVVAHHLLKRYLGALQPVVWQNHARQLRLLWSSIYRTLASLNLSCQLWLFEVLNRLGRWSVKVKR